MAIPGVTVGTWIGVTRGDGKMRLRYAWGDLPFLLLGVVLLIPLCIQLAEIVIDFITSTEF